MQDLKYCCNSYASKSPRDLNTTGNFDKKGMHNRIANGENTYVATGMCKSLYFLP